MCIRDRFTGKQKQMLAGSVEILGKKFKPAEDEGKPTRHWYSCYWGEEAQAALDDIVHGEPVIYCTVDGVFVGTRLKRKKCKGGSTIKTARELDKFLSELEPNNPLQSIKWRGSAEPPEVNAYNLVLSGPGWNGTVLDSLPETVGYVNTTSTDEIYDFFLDRRNGYNMLQADIMIDQMLTDVQKGEKTALVVAGGMKEAGVARKNCLMKKVFIHESKSNFIQNARADGGDLEMVVIRGDVAGTKFGDYGGVVFEMFYRANLDDFMYLSLIHISEPTRLLSISYAVFCLKKKNKSKKIQ
eukprot:TRINITY_DN30840_c0_g1_i1.p1 TRINITY_DN30840_c0_g1~~TRINITY_DN30840_c0_g1_i1.p1  ORF type:complete len:298 (+),score=92.61 TRINITY_DN30840_c0_g1_i1:124-1017(+)